MKIHLISVHILFLRLVNIVLHFSGKEYVGRGIAGNACNTFFPTPACSHVPLYFWTLHWFFFYFYLGHKKNISHENERENKHEM